MQYYGSRISDNIATTSEGYLICVNVPIARTGEQEYLASEVLVDGGNEKVIVHRPEEEVFAKETIASFEGKPLVNDHPNEDVTVENISNYSIGHAQNVRRGTDKDSDKIIADIYVTDADAIEDIKNGKREISCGYDCAYVENADGTFTQTKIRGNHIALVDRGRAGDSVKIRDSATRTYNDYKELMKNAKSKEELDKLWKEAENELSSEDIKLLQADFINKADKMVDEDTTEVINEALTNIENEEMVEDADFNYIRVQKNYEEFSKIYKDFINRKYMGNERAKDMFNKAYKLWEELTKEKDMLLTGQKSKIDSMLYQMREKAKEISRIANADSVDDAEVEDTENMKYMLLAGIKNQGKEKIIKKAEEELKKGNLTKSEYESIIQYAKDIRLDKLSNESKKYVSNSDWLKKADIGQFSGWLNDNKKEKDSEKRKESEFWRLRRTSEEIAVLDRKIKECEKQLNSLKTITPIDKFEEVVKKEAINDFQTSIKNYSDAKRELERMAKIKVGDSMKDNIKDSLTPFKDKIADSLKSMKDKIKDTQDKPYPSLSKALSDIYKGTGHMPDVEKILKNKYRVLIKGKLYSSPTMQELEKRINEEVEKDVYKATSNGWKSLSAYVNRNDLPVKKTEEIEKMLQTTEGKKKLGDIVRKNQLKRYKDKISISKDSKPTQDDKLERGYITNALTNAKGEIYGQARGRYINNWDVEFEKAGPLYWSEVYVEPDYMAKIIRKGVAYTVSNPKVFRDLYDKSEKNLHQK